ncbi:hypothetical protein B5S31_g1807 [[Candida] boidinii]|nr:hypothetical protein B5S31_g1807 [[Candida] boidinii]
MQITTLSVSGMTCSSCVNSVTKALEKNQGVISSEVSLMTETAVVKHDPTKITASQISEIIEDSGFDAVVLKETEQQQNDSNLTNNIKSFSSSSDEQLQTTTVSVSGMTCGACVNTVTSAINALDGVTSTEVSLMTETAVVKHNPMKSTTSNILEAIEDCGFESSLIKEDISNNNTESHNNNNTQITTLSITGMTCSSCVNSITNSINSLQGVESVNISLMSQVGTIKHDPSLSSSSQLKEAIEDCGFDANILEETEISNENSTNKDTTEKVQLKIFGMTCSNCTNSIENSLRSLEGIISCDVALSTEMAKVTYNPDIIGIRQIISEIEDCGFDAILDNPLDTATQLQLISKDKEIKYWRSIFAKSLFFGIPAFILGHIIPILRMSTHLKLKPIRIIHGLYLETFIQFCIATYFQTILARRFYVHSYKALKHGTGTMDLLICTSTTIVYIYSIISMLCALISSRDYMPKVLFDTSVMLFIFVSLGKWVESRAKGSTSTALTRLLSLTPSSCVIIEEGMDAFKDKSSINPTNFTTKTISIDLLQKKDVVLVLPGSRVPTDGICIFGSSEVDESLLTGESLPVFKSEGSRLIGGSVNTSGALYLLVDTLGESTQLQQIVKLVKDAQIVKAPIQTYADEIGSKFIQSILALALMTFISWCIYLLIVSDDDIADFFKDPSDGKILYSVALQIAISVIVVACPCALGLAAPTAVMVGTGVAAENGILIKGGDVLEVADQINCVIFDKTGTITTGKMTLINNEFIEDSDVSEIDLWKYLAAVESTSEHPIGKAIFKNSMKKLEILESKSSISDLSIKYSKIIPGSGIITEISTPDGKIKTVKVGNVSIVQNSNITNDEDFTEYLLLQQSKISSVGHIVIENKYHGFIELSDTIKPDARKTINDLQSAGFTVGMVSGDNKEAAREISKLVNIPLSNCCYGTKPDQKLHFIKSLQDDLALKVAFVGDGINDAPALVQADLGIAIATGTDIAIDAADFVLLSGSSEHIENDHEYYETHSTTSLSNIISALSIASKTLHCIKTNFLFAIAYNFVMLPIAMGILIIPCDFTINPMIASASMACSSISVVFNSLRLKRWSLCEISNQAIDYDIENTVNGDDISEFSITNFQKNTRQIKISTSFGDRIRRAFSSKSSNKSSSYELLEN